MNLNKDGLPRKRGSGRTKGAVSLVPVRFGDVKTFFGDDSQIIMGRKFLESIGFIESHKMELKREDSGSFTPVVKKFNFKTKKWDKK